MKYYLGDYVMVKDKGVCRIHEAGFLDDKYSGLARGGGTVTFTEDEIIEIVEPEFLNNVFEQHYFRDRILLYM